MTSTDFDFVGDLSYLGVLDVRDRAQTETQDHGDVIITTPNNTIVGNATFFVEGKIIEQVAFKPKELLESAAKCTARVVAVYTGLKSGLDYGFCGTAFFVAPEVLATAWHVVKPTILLNKNTATEEQGNLTKLLFTTNVNGTRNTKSVGSSSWYPAMPLNCSSSKILVEKYTIHELGPFFGQEKQWECSNDFAFLHSTEFTSKDFLLPKAPPASGACGVVSYPGFISEEKFIQKYTHHKKKTPEEASRLYLSIRAEFGKFQLKSVSCGTFSVSPEQLFIHHKAPTVGGSSGGPFIVATNVLQQNAYFAGVHIGGDLDMNNNFAISVERPEFKQDYKLALESVKSQALLHAEVVEFLK